MADPKKPRRGARKPPGAKSSDAAATASAKNTMAGPSTPDVLRGAPGRPQSRQKTADAHVMDLIRDQYRHGKPILALGASSRLLQTAGVPLELPTGRADPGLVMGRSESTDEAIAAFIESLAKHRHFERETDPPSV